MDLSSLKNIDLKKLQEINIKDIDLKQLKDIDSDQLKFMVKRYLDIIVIVIAVLAALIGSIQIISGYAKNTEEIRSEVNTQQALLEVVEQNKKHTKKYAEIMKKFGTYLPGDAIISEISNIAVNTNVQIEKVTPRPDKSNELLQVSYLDLEVSSQNYEDIVTFTKSIELLDNSIRIEEWKTSNKSFTETVTSQTLDNRGRPRQENIVVEKIALTMTLSSVQVIK